MIARRPALFLSNWSSRRSPEHHGPGRKLTIMRRPRRWEHGDGVVEALTPTADELDMVREGAIDFEGYADLLRGRWRPERLRPGALTFWPAEDAMRAEIVMGGDTLCCACARGTPCHRWVAAELLIAAGWGVVLDGCALDFDWGLHAVEGAP